ncbi:Transport protein particle (TRAPP) component like protein [Aduncisulcus paluster]|uniref:Transport protein particle (TRAPP) component like protein n=1 Tax=Aduncisulcus paluster TaxID=2918883 RepID=A0ABQ5K4A6_9EUKA|nr:Transport protein particle (TRAPP) component like protein [Aduncisulcus paluster]
MSTEKTRCTEFKFPKGTILQQTNIKAKELGIKIGHKFSLRHVFKHKSSFPLHLSDAAKVEEAINIFSREIWPNFFPGQWLSYTHSDGQYRFQSVDKVPGVYLSWLQFLSGDSKDEKRFIAIICAFLAGVIHGAFKTLGYRSAVICSSKSGAYINVIVKIISEI